jgi:hypothetical protein
MLSSIAGAFVMVAIIIRILLKSWKKMELKRAREAHHAYGQRRDPLALDETVHNGVLLIGHPLQAHKL